MHRSRQRGLTLIEAMAALLVMMVGALGMLSLHAQGQKMAGDARRITRATAIAQDLVGQMAFWDYTDARLAVGARKGDAAVGDPTFEFERAATPVFDHGEADLTLGGTAWLGIPTADLAAAGFERYWNVAYVDDGNGNGVADAVRIGVIVRFPSGSGWRRVALVAVKPNPADAR